MATTASESEVIQELARESLIAISECIPDTVSTSKLLPDMPVFADDVDIDDFVAAEEFRSQLISISYTQSPDTQPSPSLLENLGA